MLSSIQRRPWTCIRCLLREQRRQQRRRPSSTVASITRTAFDRLHLFADHVPPGADHDDRTLRQVFDSRSVWQDFSRRTRACLLGPSSGLFRNRYLKNPDGFDVFANVTLKRCKRLVSKILKVSTVEGYKGIVRDLDALSDLLCRVIDLCDFVRASHPDVRYQEAATAAYALMFEYMNELNTTTGLYDQLKRALADPNVVASWSEEEQVTAHILMRDFNKSAIDLPAEAKRKFVDLSNEINQLGSDFINNTGPAQSFMTLQADACQGLDPALQRRFVRGGKLFLPIGSSESTMALRTIVNEDTRYKIYLASRTCGRQQIHRLEQLLRRRAEIAKLSGFSSYAHMTLAEKMAGSPESVNRFLEALLQSNQGRIRTEYDQLSRLKAGESTGDEPAARIQAWDKEFYMSKYKLQTRTTAQHSEPLQQFFSLGTVMQGLSRLFSRLYGIRFVPREASPGETWNDDVRRLDVIDESEGHIAVLYCDLFERLGKNPNPAHFTLRCSRRIFDEELAEAATEASEQDDAVHAEEDITDGMASTRNGRGELYQLPTIALICDFSRPASKHPTLLSFREVQTLFHEMGHAVHSVLGRTAMQNVSGTRCATDFAELPSVIMEDFAADRAVLGLFARHWDTDAPLPHGLVEEKMARDRLFEGLEIESQLGLAALDQAYHSALPLDPAFDSTRLYHAVTRDFGTVEEPREASWQGLFGHLFGYGATYYSYLFDRAIAGKIWRHVFKRTEHSPVSRECGTRFRDEVLRWGGSRDGWRCVAAVLGDEALADGGERAMVEVGRWGVTGR